MAFSVSQSRAEYRRKMAIKNADKKAAKEQNNNNNNNNKNNYYKPKAITITCRYCKEDGHKVGHYDKALGRFVTTCVKAIEASRRKSDYNKRQRQLTSNWKNQVSEAVAKETGSGGWDTAGSKNKVSAAQKTEKPVLKFAKNRFAIDEDSDEETWPTTRSAAATSGAWLSGPPVMTEVEIPAKIPLTRAPRNTTTPVNSDCSDDDAAFAAPALERSTGAPPSLSDSPPERWGDDW